MLRRQLISCAVELGGWDAVALLVGAQTNRLHKVVGKHIEPTRTEVQNWQRRLGAPIRYPDLQQLIDVFEHTKGSQRVALFSHITTLIRRRLTLEGCRPPTATMQWDPLEATLVIPRGSTEYRLVLSSTPLEASLTVWLSEVVSREHLSGPIGPVMVREVIRIIQTLSSATYGPDTETPEALSRAYAQAD